jgi:uncharacterized membrane protein
MQDAIVSTNHAISRWVRWLVPVVAALVITAWLAIAPEGALGKLDAIGYAVCHRIDARSFHVDGRQLPLCARCTGEFAAAAVAILFQCVRSGRATRFPNAGVLAVFGVLVAVFAVDGLNSLMSLVGETSGAAGAGLLLYEPNNTLRLLTGSGMGIALAGVLYPSVNQSLWRSADPRRTLTWRNLGGLVFLVLAMDGLILSEQPVLLYAAGILSALGVLGLLVMVFGVLWVTMTGQESSFDRIRDLWLPACSGLTLALLLIVSIDLLRYKMTGTWGGFPGLTG